MSTLTWNDDLVLDHGPMDQTHREFVSHLAAVEAALDETPDHLPDAFDRFVQHTVEHFAQEERWMQRIGFATENCHTLQHRHVLEVLREVRTVIGTTGDAQILRRLLTELAAWFPAHAQMMDQALAETMQACGFDIHTGRFNALPVAEAEPITGCGSAQCR